MNSKKKLVLLCGGSLLEVLDEPTQWTYLSDVINSKNILVYAFARNSSDWSALMSKLHSAAITKSLSSTWILAAKDIAERQVQQDSADTIFIPGGDEMRFFETVTMEELRELLDHKHIVGSSAGVNIFSQVFYSNDRLGIFSGSGLLPIKSICHYSAKNESEYLELKNHPAPGQVLALADKEIVIFNPE